MHAYHAWPFLSAPDHSNLSAVWAILIHGSSSLLVVWPIITRSDRRVALASGAFLAGVGIDLDHAVVAGSLSPRSMETLAQRPETHSLVACAVLAIAVLAVTRRVLIAWSIFAVLVGHLLFDAAGGSTQWLFPLRHPDSIPWLACPLGLAVLVAISGALARRRAQRDAVRRIRGAYLLGGPGHRARLTSEAERLD